MSDLFKIYWYVREKVDLPDEQVERMRERSMALSVQKALSDACLNGRTDGLQDAIGTGFRDAGKFIDMASVNHAVRGEAFLLGQEGNAERLDEIERSPGFGGWMDQFAVDTLRGRTADTAPFYGPDPVTSLSDAQAQRHAVVGPLSRGESGG